MITSARVWLREGRNYTYDCNNVVFEPLVGVLKLMSDNDTVALFAGGSWSHVVINRNKLEGTPVG